jgi:general secretion pathway protein E
VIHHERFDPAILTAFPREFLLASAVAPLREEEGTIVVCGGPESRGAAEEIGMLRGKAVHFLEEEAREVRRFVTEKYDTGSSRQEAIDEIEVDARDIRRLEELANDAPVVRFVAQVLQNAAERSASDVHVEPCEEESIIRFRIDGVLLEHDRVPRGLHAAVVSRIKILARLDIAETRRPQDGRITIGVGAREIDLRVSTVPTPSGERVVLRLLDRTSVRYGLEDLGLSGDALAAWTDLLRTPHGILLVTGPTGSGKTTTLYAAVQTLHSGRVNILTVEDPVEYRIDGIGQIQVNPRINLTFAAGLRSILRQDPDIIMVGEIRDGETAVIAVQAALTGHLVLSTLHTNDSATAAPRLVDMGVEPYLLASTIRGVLAQRLVRRLCPSCRRERRATHVEAAALGIPVDASVFEPVGCPACSGLGYRGRTGLFELLVISDEIRDLILARRPSSDILAAAHRRGLRTIREDGRIKALEGVSSPDEVIRVTEAG